VGFSPPSLRRAGPQEEAQALTATLAAEPSQRERLARWTCCSLLLHLDRSAPRTCCSLLLHLDRRGRRNSKGYVEYDDPSHPLATGRGQVKQHRAVLFDAIGGDEAPHGCQHCGRAVRWSPTDGEQQLVVDHLNHDRADNRPENLVPSCRACNSRR